MSKKLLKTKWSSLLLLLEILSKISLIIGSFISSNGENSLLTISGNLLSVSKSGFFIFSIIEAFQASKIYLEKDLVSFWLCINFSIKLYLSSQKWSKLRCLKIKLCLSFISLILASSDRRLWDLRPVLSE